jgi:hypothetical protein
MPETNDFYFEVLADNHARFAAKVKATDLKSATQYIANYPRVTTWEQIDKSQIPDDMLKRL